MDERVEVGDDGLQSVVFPRGAELGVAPRSRESWAASSVQLVNKAQLQSLYMLCSRINCHAYRTNVNIMDINGVKTTSRSTN